MSDLISREAAIKMLREKAQDYVVSMFATMTECNIAKIVAMECANELNELNGLPAVDAEPVRHGKWMNVCEMLPPEYHDNKRCSVCANFALHDRLGRVRMSRYCPNCSAKMDLEDDQT